MEWNGIEQGRKGKKTNRIKQICELMCNKLYFTVAGDQKSVKNTYLYGTNLCLGKQMKILGKQIQLFFLHRNYQNEFQ